MQVIPAIDLLGGKCVRLSQGAYETAKVYEDDPAKTAKDFAARGFNRIHVVDLDGAKAGQVVNYGALQEILTNTDLEIDFGGGVKSLADLKRVLDLGVRYVVVGSLAVNHTNLFREWVQDYGSDKLVLMLDVKGENLATMGWQQGTEMNIFDFLDNLEVGIKHVFCTDIACDGMLQGPNFDLYERLIQRYPEIRFTASGGVSSIEDLQQLADLGLDGTIVGKAIYEDKIDLDELQTIY